LTTKHDIYNIGAPNISGAPFLCTKAQITSLALRSAGLRPEKLIVDQCCFSGQTLRRRIPRSPLSLNRERSPTTVTPGRISTVVRRNAYFAERQVHLIGAREGSVARRMTNDAVSRKNDPSMSGFFNDRTGSKSIRYIGHAVFSA
jgi:hypothetical protein